MSTTCKLPYTHEDRGLIAPRATHLVVTARTDSARVESIRLCTECAKAYVGGSIEVNNGPQLITVVKL